MPTCLRSHKNFAGIKRSRGKSLRNPDLKERGYSWVLKSYEQYFPDPAPAQGSRTGEKTCPEGPSQAAAGQVKRPAQRCLPRMQLPQIWNVGEGHGLTGQWMSDYTASSDCHSPKICLLCSGLPLHCPYSGWHMLRSAFYLLTLA